MPNARIVLAGVVGALALTAGAELAAAQSTWTKMSAHVVRTDFDFPSDFYADAAIALHDTNGNCRIDSFGVGDADTMFPFLLTPQSVTHGRHVGSPFSLVPGVDAQGNITVDAAPGHCGRTLVYGEMVRNGKTYFMWFALPDTTQAPPAGYDAGWGLDFGVGSYSGTDPSAAADVRHATFVKDFRASNGTSDRVGHPPIRWWPGTAGTLASPGHVYSAEQDATRPWPTTWGLFVAATLAGDPFLNLFVGFDNVLLDVPLVAEGSWDGQTLFPSVSAGIGRAIQPLNGGVGTQVSNQTMATTTTQELQGDFNGDGRSDVALWKPGWGSVPIYHATGTGFSITNLATPLGMNWINDGTASRLVGDFTGDGRTDIAMWKPGWQTIPVYAANGAGGFAVTNGAEPSGANLINQTNAPAKLVGDFDGDGKDDIAMMRSDWRSVPVYFANGNRTFRWTNYGTPAGQNWINSTGVRRFLGDFNADGKTDILVTRDGWTSHALYVSNGNGSFTVRVGSSGAGNWMNNMAANPLVGDFDGDRRTDIAFWKGGWNSTPVYFSNGDGTFRITNFLTSAVEVNDVLARKLVGDFDGDGKSDIAVTRLGYAGVPVYTSSGAGWFNRTALTTPNGSGLFLNARAQALLGDFNADGKTDIITRSLGWSSTPTYTSLGGGAFSIAYAFHPAAQNWINQ